MKLAVGGALVALVMACVFWRGLEARAGTSGPGISSHGVAHADAAQAAELLREKKVVVLDIRTPEEHAAGRIAGSTNIDYYAADFQQRVEALDRSQAYLVHCASGRRSNRALGLFKKLQFASVVHLDGGMKAWQKAGKPTEK